MKPGTSCTRKYVGADQLNDRDLIYGAINGMTQAVGDTGHTSFMTPEQRAERSSDLSGKYVGIGVRIDTAADGLPLVVGVFKGSPAEGAGVKEGDEIVAVDGKTDRRPHDRRDRRLGPRRGRLLGQGDRQERRRPASQRELAMVRADVAVDPVSWAIVPGTKTALDASRAVLVGRGGRPEGAP